jgi:hypothetical protein
MTEAAGAFCTADFMAGDDKVRGSNHKSGSVGVPMYNVQIKVTTNCMLVLFMSSDVS